MIKFGSSSLSRYITVIQIPTYFEILIDIEKTYRIVLNVQIDNLRILWKHEITTLKKKLVMTNINAIAGRSQARMSFF